MKKEVNLGEAGVLDLLYVITRKYSGKVALQVKKGGELKSITYDELRERSVDVSAFLIKSGIEPGAHIAVLSENRPEWAVAFFGIISAAGVTIPVDAKLSWAEVSFILNDSGAVCLFVSHKWLAEVLAHRAQLKALRFIVCFDAHEEDGVFYLYDLRREEKDPRNRPEDVKPEDTVLIVYTSGTTGVAKGVELSYRNLLFETMTLYDLVRFTPADSFVSILPLNHMLEITGDLIAPLYGGAKVTYCDTLKPQQITSLLQQVKATGMVCVPLILKMFYNGIIKQVESLPPLKRRAFAALMALSKFLLKFKIRAGKILFGAVHRKFGKKFKYFICGGAPLDPQLEEAFDALGFIILQGYGLTETAPVLAVNSFRQRRYGSVGKPLPGVEVRLLKNSERAEEGEIVARGANIMKGYYNNPGKTGEVLVDGWFHTGDIGYFDRDGFLFISGRTKNMIVLGAGKKVFPEEVEQVIGESRYIREMVVFGRKATQGLRAGTEEVYAVIVPCLDSFPPGERDNKERMRGVISREIARLGKDLAEYKRIAGFSLYFGELPKTSTRKVKRKEVPSLLEQLEKDEGVDAGTPSPPPETGDDIASALREVVAQEAGVSPENVWLASHLCGDLGIDSLQKVELVCAIERKMNIAIPEDMTYEISTFQDLLRFTGEYKQGRRDVADTVDKEVKGILRRARLFSVTRLLALFVLKVFFRTYCRVKVRGCRHLPAGRSFIIAANHSSHLDFPVLLSSLPLAKMRNVVAPAAADYFYARRVRKILMELVFSTFAFERFGNFIRSMKVCRGLMKQGKSLILFPEGTRSAGGEMGKFKPGIGALAWELGIPIVPVYIKDIGKCLPKGSFFIRPGKAEVIIGEPILPAGGDNYQTYKRIAETVRQRIVELQK